jgi:hypothetical protein
MATERETFIQPLRQSSVDTCLRCKRCYMFRYRWGISPRAKQYMVASDRGKLLHRLMQLGPQGIPMVRSEVNDEVSKLLKIIDSGGDLMGDIARQVDDVENSYNQALVMATILWEKYPRPATHKVLAKEKTVKASIRLNDGSRPDLCIETELEGTLDEVVEDTESKLIWIRDYKTSSRDVMFTLTGYQWSLQCRMYRLLAGAYLQSIPEYVNRAPEGFILEILQTPTITMCDKDRSFNLIEHTFKSGPRKGTTEMQKDYFGEPTFENYLQRCKEWYTAQGDVSVKAFGIRFSESVLPPELRMDLMTAAVYRLLPAVPENFPRDETASYCKHYERVCPYYELCSTDPAAFEVVKPEIMESNDGKVEEIKTGPKILRP